MPFIYSSFIFQLKQLIRRNFIIEHWQLLHVEKFTDKQGEFSLKQVYFQRKLPLFCI